MKAFMPLTILAVAVALAGCGSNPLSPGSASALLTLAPQEAGLLQSHSTEWPARRRLALLEPRISPVPRTFIVRIDRGSVEGILWLNIDKGTQACDLQGEPGYPRPMEGSELTIELPPHTFPRPTGFLLCVAREGLSTGEVYLVVKEP